MDDFNKIVENTLDSLIVFADKHNIDRDSVLEHFSEIFSTMVKISTFTYYTRQTK